MKRLGVAALMTLAMFGQETPAVKDDTVVATLNGRKFTAADVRRLVNGAPAAVKQAFEHDPKQFLRDHAFYMLLLDYAEQNKLDQKSPWRDALEFQRLNILANAAVTHKMQSIDVTPEEQKAYFEKHQDDYREARVRMIYVPFGDPLTEEQAKGKASDLAKRARLGEDFAKLAAEGAGKDAPPTEAFTVRKGSEQPPEQMRKVILNQKVGSVTEPLRHANGYYVFRVEANDVLPYDTVRDEVYQEIQSARFREWQVKTRSEATVQFENEAFFQNIGKKQ